jgi:acyl carrier protein
VAVGDDEPRLRGIVCLCVGEVSHGKNGCSNDTLGGSATNFFPDLIESLPAFESPTLWLVTQRARQIDARGEVSRAVQLSVRELDDKIATCAPDLSCIRVDMDAKDSEDEDEDVLALLDEIYLPDGAEYLAFRGGDRYVGNTSERDSTREDSADPEEAAFAAERLALVQRLKAAPRHEQQTLLVDYLQAEISRVTGLDERLDEDLPLINIGLDSLMAVEMRNRLKTDLDAEISMVQLMEGVSIGGLAALLDQHLDAHTTTLGDASIPDGQVEPEETKTVEGSV